MRSALIALVAACILRGLVPAQSTEGLITGRVRDRSNGRPIIAAKVEALSPLLQARREVPSNGQGYYYFPQLPPGIARKRQRSPRGDPGERDDHQDDGKNHGGVLGGEREGGSNADPHEQRIGRGGGVFPEEIQGEEDEERRPEVGGHQAGMADQVRLQRGESHRQQPRAPAPEAPGPPAGEPDQEATQKEVGKPPERQDSIGRHG